MSLTNTFKALGDRNRLRMVHALFQREELCACQLIELLEVSGATASRHMSILFQAGIVESRKDGRWVHYRLSQETVELNSMFKWLEVEIKNDFSFREDIKKLSQITSCEPDELRKKQREQACCT
ncbi:MAG: winged helix-turn-helix transcriptional regulator [Opitutae bacterium]|jgi:ArsR family transcriptional regulator, arsenate/arsenite/antimonite-responsive transcriptional repressor|nr:winged helix-turn-helix transcriptional regulator [Opitutae bacterium]MBT5715984.1 winged helix-turn-helix transcriptional regulator [Opitutae bacterium]MDG1928338.1 metalloregulator ArsR/SmtB family transcription factor [Nitrospinaceae bacterium]